MRIGTRGSALALAQATWVRDRLQDSELVEITTAGDRDRARGDKSRWTGALEAALLAGEIDLCVHSAKDVPGELAPGTWIAAVPPRADAHDVAVGGLGAGARVGTSALRRRGQLLAARPDLEVVELRGNVDTRLRKLAAGEVDALVLAAAGLQRLGLAPADVTVLGEHVPAPGQGCLALQARAGDDRASALTDPAAHAALMAERAAVRALGASCRSAAGIHATSAGIRAWVGAPDGSAWIADALDGPPTEQLGEELAQRMLAAGAGALLHDPADGLP